MRSTTLLVALAVAFVLPAIASAHSARSMRAGLRAGIAWHRARTWTYQDRAGVRRSPTVYAERRTRSVAFLRWLDRLWSRRRVAARRFASRRLLASTAGGIAHEALWLCIHKNEGAWNANTGNGYYGGLQMTSGWGGVKRPDKLSPAAQMALAERELRAAIRRGDEIGWLEQQWPNTAPRCLGLA